MKCEPDAYTIDDLERDGVTGWEGVRNYQARNFMRDDMQVGDKVLFYASNADPSGVTGLARIVRAGYPDPGRDTSGRPGGQPTRCPDVVHRGHRVRRALHRRGATRDAEGDCGSGVDDGDAERQPAVGATGDRGRVRDRRAARAAR
jgi:hypothetical protein